MAEFPHINVSPFDISTVAFARRMSLIKMQNHNSFVSLNEIVYKATQMFRHSPIAVIDK